MDTSDLGTLDFEGERISFDQLFITMAGLVARRSTCSRLKVGTIITSIDYRQVYALGYNGNASGLPNVCDRQDVGNCGCIHSEENAIINCNEPRNIPKHIFVTHSPCIMCAKKLINLGGVVSLRYVHHFRDHSPLELLSSVGIQITHL